MHKSTFKRNLGKKEKRLIIVISVFVAVCVTAAVCVFAAALLTDSSSDLKDLNGAESIELNTITIDDIVNGSMSNSMIGASKKTKRRNVLQSDVLTGIYNDYNYETVELKVKKFSGISILQATKAKKDTVTFTMISEVTKGNLRAAVIVDGEYYADFELNGISHIVIEDAVGKVIIIKIAGEEACMGIKVSRSFE